MRRLDLIPAISNAYAAPLLFVIPAIGGAIRGRVGVTLLHTAV